MSIPKRRAYALILGTVGGYAAGLAIVWAVV